MYRFLGMVILVAATASVLLAGEPSPEIDASTGAAAIGLLTGAVLILRSRKKRQ
jgi:hypothetical protein